MSYSASHGAPLILMWHAVSLHLEPPFSLFFSFSFFPQNIFVPRITASPQAMRATQDKRRSGGRGGVGGGEGSLLLDKTKSSYFFF